jgi:hypothetical protein
LPVVCTKIFLDRSQEPRPGVGPHLVRLPPADAHDPRGLLVPHAHEEAELHQARHLGVLLRQPLQGIIHREQFVGGHLHGGSGVIYFHAVQVASVLGGLLAAGVVDEDAPHGGRGGGEKMLRVLPGTVFLVHQTQPGFMDQRGGLQGLAGPFVGHPVGGQPAQFAVNQWQQLVRSKWISTLDCR